MTAEQADSDVLVRWAGWMTAHMERAARGWGMTLTRPPRVGYMGMGNSCYGPASGPDGPRWVRLSVRFDSADPAELFTWVGERGGERGHRPAEAGGPRRRRVA